jgi:putative ABC transport system permease protein
MSWAAVLRRYVRRELLRNPRRTLASLAGVILGVGLFSGVLFFIDGSGASMTKRAIAPLAIDLQRVLTSPLGGGLELTERVAATGPLRAGQRTTVTLTVRNAGVVPVNEVVVKDEPPSPLRYVRHTARLDGRPIDAAAGFPLAQGPARIGLNIGTVAPGRSVRITYVGRAERAIGAAGHLPLRGTISSQEQFVPARANAERPLTLDQLAAKVGRVPGVASADRLAFVDVPAGSLRGGGRRALRGAIRVFGFDERYREHYPSIRLVAGSIQPGAAVLSAEASRALRTGPGGHIELSLPGRARPVALPVSGVTDLSRANPLFFSRRSGKLEDFLYVPNSVVLDPATFEHVIVPAFQAASAARGSIIKTLPLLELDMLVERSRLHAEPGTALDQTRAIARAVRRIAPRQDYLIDNISNTLQVARDDASVAKRMFVFLGLPAALLAAFLAAYAGSILASAQRREQANLRLRGADRGHLLRLLAYRTLVLAGLGSAVGTALGFLSVLVILGGSAFFEAAAGQLAVSAVIAVAVGMVVTALALYVPGHRSLSREIAAERGELPLGPVPAWRRLRLDFILLGAVVIGETIAFEAGAFDSPPGSVYAGRAVSLPSYLLLAPIAVWVAGLLFFLRVFQFAAARMPVPPPPRFGSPIAGTLARTLRRRSWSLGGGVVAVGLVVAFGTSLAFFTGTFDAAKAADSRFVVGADLRVTPSVLSAGPHTAGFASKLVVPGVSAATPVVFKLENAVLAGPFDQDRADLAAIEPSRFARVAPLSDSSFVGDSAAQALSALARDPRAVLVETNEADNLQIEKGAKVKVLLARGTKRQTLVTLHVVGLFKRFPGFPQGLTLVSNLGYYRAATGIRKVDFFLLRTVDGSHSGLTRAVVALQAGPGRNNPLVVDTREAALDKDQSSLTALNVHGLLDLDSFYTLLMAAAGIAIFVFGMMLQRRREYVTLRARGMQLGEIRALVLGESALVGLFGLVAGLVVGSAMGFLLVHVLRPLFFLPPDVTVNAGDLATLAGLAVAATLVSALAATDLLRRLKPTELLRDE